MKKILLVLFTAFVMSGSFSCPDKLNAQDVKPEHRGMWVQGFYMNYPGGTVDADDVIDKARSANLNVLYVGSYGSGQGVFESQYVTPWPEDEHWCDTPLYFDVLQYFVEETEGDFDIIPWLCIGLMPSYMEDQVCNPMRSNLDWRMVDAANYHYSWLDYANPEAIEWLLAVIDELVRNYDIKGIHLDYIRNPRDCSTYVSVSKDALRRYEEKYPSDSDIDTQIILPHDVLLPTFGKYLAYHPITNPTIHYRTLFCYCLLIDRYCLLIDC